MKRILLTRGLQDFALRELKKHYTVDIYSGPAPMPKRKLIKRIAGADGLICFPYDTVDHDVIDAGDRLRTISTYSVGYDHVDIEYARERGILVGYTPDVLTDATADIAVTLMLDLVRRVTEGDRLIRAGRWKAVFGADEYAGYDIGSKTLGILGLGRIGSSVAVRAKAFGMRILYHSRHRASARHEKKLGARFVSLNELLKRSDVLSVHVPYNRFTHAMIDKTAIKKMKKTAFIINTSRGRVVNESDLARALRDGSIAGAGLDVFESEPLPRTSPLVRMENVVLAPHIGSSTVETRKKMAEITVRNIRRGLAGRKPVHYVG